MKRVVGERRITAFSEPLGAERYRRLAVAVNVITPKDLSGPSRETANVLAPRLGLRLRRFGPFYPPFSAPRSVFQDEQTSKLALSANRLIAAATRLSNKQHLLSLVFRRLAWKEFEIERRGACFSMFLTLDSAGSFHRSQRGIIDALKRDRDLERERVCSAIR